MDDLKAIAQLKRGDIAGLSALVARYQVRAVRTAYLITQNESTAQDIVQEAFLEVYRSIRQFDSQRPFSPWFMRIVVNKAIKSSQQANQFYPLEMEEEEQDVYVDPMPGPEALIENAATEQAVWRALEALSPERRAVIVLRFYFEMSESEISEQLGIPAGTVKSRLHTAKQKLRYLLQGVMNDG